MDFEKYKLLNVKQLNEKFDNFRLNSFNNEAGQIMDINHKYIATCWEGVGATVAIIDKTKPHSLAPNFPIIRGGMDGLTDLHWSPFIPNLLSVSTEGGYIKLFQVPEVEDIKADITKEAQKYTEHTKKVISTKFHPCTKDVVASCSVGKEVHVWSVENGQSITKTLIGDIPSSLDWNQNGSLLACASKDKSANIIDPRAQQVVLKVEGVHATNKPARVVFLDMEHFVSCGLSGNSERELKLFDIRNPSVIKQTIQFEEKIPQSFLPWYDRDINLLVLPSKGANIIYFYGFKDGELKRLNAYSDKTAFKYFGYSERRYSDYKSNEFYKLYRENNKKLEIFSIGFIRRNSTFDPTLFTPTFNGVSVLSGDEWKAGNNVDYQLSRFEDLNNQGSVIDFKIKEKGFIDTSIPLDQQVKELTAKVQSLTDELNAEKAMNSQLREEIASLRQQLNK